MRRFVSLVATVATITAVAVSGSQFVSAPVANAVASGSLGAAAASSWQSNATVWKMAYGSGKIFMVGDFTSLRPPGDAAGTGEQPADYFAALDASTGTPATGFDDTHAFTGQSSGLPLTNGAVATSPDGSVVYVGGNFTTVDGVLRNHIAAFSATTGALLPWAPNVSGPVRAIKAVGNVVYVGGSFGQVNHAAAGPNLAAIDASSGKAVQWGSGVVPSTDNVVDALDVTSDGQHVVVGGYFDEADGLTASADGTTPYNKVAMFAGVGAADAGALEPFSADSIVPVGTDADNDGCVSDVKTVDISNGVAYFGDEGTGEGCFDGTWAVTIATGELVWQNDCLGATQIVQVVGNYLYKGSHAHDCQSENTNGDPSNFPQVPDGQARHLLNENLTTGWLGPWDPFTDAGPNLGPRAMATDGTQLYVGGDFSNVNHKAQQGIARFTPTSDYATPKPAQPIAVASAGGSVNVYAQAPVDLDSPDLTMELFRDGGTTPIATEDVTSLFWKQPVIGFTDSGLSAGSTHTYTVAAIETDGSGALSSKSLASPSVTVQSSSNGYAATVLAQNPAAYWRFGEPAGSVVAADSSPNLDGGAYSGGVTLGAAGAIKGDSDTAASFDGSTGLFSAGQSQPSPTTFSVDAWFKTTSTTGGKIIGFGDEQTASSSNYDKQVYLTDAGKLVFGTYDGAPEVITSAASYNDGKWHQVIGTQGPGGMALYVDGQKIGANPTTTNQSYTGYWRVGGDNLDGWPSAPTSYYFNGTIDDVSVYDQALSRTQVAAQYLAAGYSLPTLPGSTTPYAKAVLGNDPSTYWRFDESSGTTALDLSGNGDNATYGSGSVHNSTGAIDDGVADGSVGITGNANSVVVGQEQQSSPAAFSIEAWFKTSQAAGKIVGFGDSASATGSMSYDKAIYFDSGNTLKFGVYPGSEVTISAPQTNLADGQWHYVVATQGPSGMTLYVDGQQVASNTTTTNQSYNGYWHVGGDTSWGPTDTFDGSIDEVAIYPYALSSSQVDSDYRIGTGQTTTPLAPDAPTGVAVTSSTATSADVSWNVGGGATSYQVQRSVAGADSFVDVGEPVTTTSLHDAGLTPGASYDYRVIATNAGGSSGPSSVATVTLVPGAAGTLTAAANGPNEIDLSWGAAAGATSYDVQRGPAGSGTFPTDLGSTASRSFADTGLDPGGSYSYRVVPSDSAGSGTASNTVTAMTTPAQVTGLEANPVSGTEIDLSWDAAAGAATYTVQRAPHGSSSWSTISSGSAVTSYDDTALEPSTSYDYRVMAVDAGGSGSFSATRTASTPDVAPGKVTGLSGTGGSSEVMLTWQAAAGATAYEVDRSSTSSSTGFIPVATGLKTASYTDKSVSPSTQYWYEVIASNGAGSAAASDPLAVATASANLARASNSFEGGRNGAALTAANSGGASGKAFNAVTCLGRHPAYSSTAAHGLLGASLAVGRSSCFLQWGKTTITATTTSYGRMYLYLPSALRGAAVLVRLGDAGLHRDVQIDLTAAGKLTLVDAKGSVDATFTNPVPTGQWVRLEWSLKNSTTAGGFSLRMYSGDNLAPIETQSVSKVDTGTTFASAQFGSVVATDVPLGFIGLDDIAYGTAGPLGPAS